ncbi:MAG TPA: hypothetical protein VGP30_03620, partial [Candidatus Limnocylindrales bacterium]|nr:hypothetical protein [Candidatus Limnocylindrales bacterium]
FLEQDGSYVVRLLMGTRAGARHVLAEFTADELKQMVDAGAGWRADRPTGAAQPKPPVPPGSG